MKNKKNILWLIAGIVIVITFLLPIFFIDSQQYIIDLIEKFPYLAPLVIIVFRFLGVVLAPLPGAPIAFASIAVLPWYEAFIWNFIGIESGAIVAFLIARKFREPVVAHFVPLEKIHKWQDKISHKKQFWSFTGFRVMTLLAFDFVSYAAGLTELPFRTFLMATFLIDIPVNFIFFYLGGFAIKYSLLFFAVFVFMFMMIVFILNNIQRRKNNLINE